MNEEGDPEVRQIAEGIELEDLVDKPLPTCQECEKKAAVLVLLDGDDGPMSIAVTRCDEHLIEGGYDIDIYDADGLTGDLVDWMDQLEGKGGTKAFQTFMTWLQTPGGRAIIAVAAHPAEDA